MVNEGQMWGRGRRMLYLGLKQGKPCLFSQYFFHLKLPLLSRPVNILSIFPGSLQTHSPMKPSWISLSSCWVPKALFTSLVKDPSYSAPSFIHIQTTFLSSWGIRSVHQALCWTLILTISKPHNKLHSKYWPHFTDEETEIKWGHITGMRTVIC